MLNEPTTISPEEIAREFESMLKYLDENFAKVLSAQINAKSTNKAGFYSCDNDLSEKQRHFVENHDLIKKARIEAASVIKERFDPNSAGSLEEKHAP